MAYVIECRHASVQHDEFCSIVAFTDDPVEVTRYVMIQSTHAPSEQDHNTDTEGLYLELDDQINSVYRGISQISFDGERLQLTLTARAQKILDVDGYILLRLETKIPGADEALQELRKIAYANGIEFSG